MLRCWRPLVAAIIVGARGAHAADLWGTGPLADSTLQTTEDFELRYHHVDDKVPGFEDRDVLDYFEQVNRLNFLLASPKNFSFAAQLDEVALWANRYYLNDQEVIEREILDPAITSPWQSAYILLEKWNFTKKWKPVEVGIGTSTRASAAASR
jgi:hypothetical protein